MWIHVTTTTLRIHDCPITLQNSFVPSLHSHTFTHKYDQLIFYKGVSIPLPKLHCLDYRSFIVIIKIHVSPPILLLFFKIILTVVVPLFFHIHFFLYFLLIKKNFFGCAAQLAGSYFPNQGLNLGPQQWKSRVLTTGLPGNVLHIHFRINYSVFTKKFLLGFWLELH